MSVRNQTHDQEQNEQKCQKETFIVSDLLTQCIRCNLQHAFYSPE